MYSTCCECVFNAGFVLPFVHALKEVLLVLPCLPVSIAPYFCIMDLLVMSLQERVQLTRHVTEGNIVPIVANTCDRLVRHVSVLWMFGDMLWNS